MDDDGGRLRRGRIERVATFQQLIGGGEQRLAAGQRSVCNG